MKVEPIHHVPMRPEYKSPFSAAYAIEGGRLIFFSGCCTVPTYHKHPHDPDDERQWLAGDFREQTERTFAHIKEILDAAGAKMKDIMKLTIFTTQMDSQNILNEISARYFGKDNPPARVADRCPDAGASWNADRDRGRCRGSREGVKPRHARSAEPAQSRSQSWQLLVREIQDCGPSGACLACEREGRGALN